MNRRGFLGTILAAGMAPYIMSGGIASGVLMPVKSFWIPPAIASEVLDLFTAEGILLASIEKMPPSRSDPLAQYMLGGVITTGLFAKAVYRRPGLDPLLIPDFWLNNNQLIVGSTIQLLDFRLVAA